MRILILSQWFHPEPNFKGLPFARELAKRGHEVEILTGFPNYPGGKVYQGYRIQLFSRETIDGISIIRVALFPSHDRSSLKRILNYLSFAFFAGFLGPLLVRKADVMYVFHPPPTIGFAAIMIRILRGIPFVYDVQDLWPDSLSATGMIRNKSALGIVSVWCSLVYRFAKAIVVLSPGFKTCLISRGVPAEKIQVLYNWSPDEPSGDSNLDGLVPDDSRWRDRFNVVFAGNMGPAQSLECVMEAAEKIQHSNPSVQFVLIGTGILVNTLKALAAQKSLPNVLFLPRVSHSEARQLLQKADALLVHLKKDPLFEITIPSKTQAYLAAGRPILIGVEGDAARLVEKAQAGFAFQSEDSGALLNAIEKLLDLSSEEREAMGERGRLYYENNLSRSVSVSEFEKLFAQISQ